MANLNDARRKCVTVVIIDRGGQLHSAFASSPVTVRQPEMLLLQAAMQEKAYILVEVPPNLGTVVVSVICHEGADTRASQASIARQCCKRASLICRVPECARDWKITGHRKSMCHDFGRPVFLLPSSFAFLFDEGGDEMERRHTNIPVMISLDRQLEPSRLDRGEVTQNSL